MRTRLTGRTILKRGKEQNSDEEGSLGGIRAQRLNTVKTSTFEDGNRERA